MTELILSKAKEVMNRQTEASDLAKLDEERLKE